MANRFSKTPNLGVFRQRYYQIRIPRKSYSLIFLSDKEHEYFCLPFLDCSNRETFGFETTVGDIKKV